MGAYTVDVTDASFQAEVLGAELPVIVDFWAPWCGPCVAVAPTLEDLAKEYAGRLKICKMNVDESKEIPAEVGVRSVPFFGFFRAGKMVDSATGLRSRSGFVELIEAFLKAS